MRVDVDANGLFVGAKPEDAWSKRFAKTCRSGQSLYHAGVALPNKPNAIEMIEITHSEPR
jgi:hypothetical protein